MKTFSSKRRWSAWLQRVTWRPVQARPIRSTSSLRAGRRMHAGPEGGANDRIQAELTTWKVLCGWPATCVALLFLPTLFPHMPIRKWSSERPRSQVRSRLGPRGSQILVPCFFHNTPSCILKINHNSLLSNLSSNHSDFCHKRSSPPSSDAFSRIFSPSCLYVAKAERKL